MGEREHEVRVRQSPNRCPYCHDDCLEQDLLAVCRSCVAKHHARCWSEHGACSSCGHERALEDAPASGKTTAEDAVTLVLKTVAEAQIAGEGRFARRVLALVFSLCAVVCLSVALVAVIGALVAGFAFGHWGGVVPALLIVVLTGFMGKESFRSAERRWRAAAGAPGPEAERARPHPKGAPDAD